MVLRKQGQKCSVKETAVEWAQLEAEQKAKYQREADKVNALIAAANHTRPAVRKNQNDEYDAHDSSDLANDDEDELEEDYDSEVENSLKRESHNVAKSNHRASNVPPNDLRAVKAEPEFEVDLSNPELFDPKELRITRKNFDVTNMKQRISTYNFFSKHLARIIRKSGLRYSRQICAAHYDRLTAD